MNQLTLLLVIADKVILDRVYYCFSTTNSAPRLLAAAILNTLMSFIFLDCNYSLNQLFSIARNCSTDRSPNDRIRVIFALSVTKALALARTFVKEDTR